MKNTNDSKRQTLPLAEAQILGIKKSYWEDLMQAIEALEPIRQEWSREFRNSSFTACGIAYMAGIIAGKRLERACRNR